MEGKIKLEENTVMQTLVMPLYGRALCSKKNPDVFPDKSAEAAIEKIDYDFSQLKYAEATVMVWAMRRQFLGDRAKEYLKIVFESELDKTVSDVPKEYMLNHMVCDFAETVRWWMANEAYSPEEISRFFFSTTPFV